jgi:hypothetical protein
MFDSAPSLLQKRDTLMRDHELRERWIDPGHL